MLTLVRCLALSLFWILCSFVLACAAGQGPSAARAERSTFDVIAPLVTAYVAHDALHEVAERAPRSSAIVDATGQLVPTGDARSDVELAAIMGLLSDWEFRLRAQEGALGIASPPPDARVELLRDQLEWRSGLDPGATLPHPEAPLAGVVR